MPDDVTPQVAAPAPDAGQPALPAVPAITPVIEMQATPAAEPAVTAPDLSVELETVKRRYAASSEEALRLYRENESLKAAKAAPPPPAQPTYSPEQLETWKEQWLVEASTKPEKAQEAAHQVRLIDAELRKLEVNRFAGQQMASQVFDKIRADLQPILNQYKDDLQPGMPLYQEAQALHQQMVTLGMVDNMATAGSAVLLALAKSGKLQAGGALKASQTATQNLNQALKSAAAAGSGAASQNAAPGPDFTKMNPKTPEGVKAFQEYRRSLGVGS